MTPPTPSLNGEVRSEVRPAAAGRTAATTRDSTHDILETIVFVVVLVLLLKTFVAEAFVIPTGSMATTLLGHHKEVACPACGQVFAVNCSDEVEPQNGRVFSPTESAICPNCRAGVAGLSEQSPRTGDRVLVAKFLYDSGVRRPQRHDVVVFKFPGYPPERVDGYPRSGPFKNHSAMNYIKRLVGLPGETIGIYWGDLYVAEGLHQSDPHAPHPLELHWPQYTYADKDVEQLRRDACRPVNDPNRHFTIIRKPPAQVLALSRLVYDNDQQAKDLIGLAAYQRWVPEAGHRWQAIDEMRRFHHPGGGGQLEWLRYRHVVRSPNHTEAPRPRLISDFMAYNTVNGRSPSANWVGDLILEAEVTLSDVSPESELRLELTHGVDRFQARVSLATGNCSLWRCTDKSEQPLTASPVATPLAGRGTHQVRFANVDRRLILWVDGRLIFGDGLAYDPPPVLGPTENDLHPASIGVRGGDVTVAHLRLLRDTYYTASGSGDGSDVSLTPDIWWNVAKWDEVPAFSDRPLRELVAARTIFVQAGHYLCMGDNSPASSDGRDWGLVPQRLLLGRALLVYYPFSRAGLIR